MEFCGLGEDGGEDLFDGRVGRVGGVLLLGGQEGVEEGEELGAESEEGGWEDGGEGGGVVCGCCGGRVGFEEGGDVDCAVVLAGESCGGLGWG